MTSANAHMTGATRLVFILADPVGHVIAPRIYNPAFAAAGLDWSLVPLGVASQDLQATVAQLARSSNFQGLNITMPHKAACRALCARVGPHAARTGVVNTMRVDADGQWSGESFDGTGFVDAARANNMLDVDSPVTLVGAGGAGVAIALALADAGVRRLTVIDTDTQRKQTLIQTVRQNFSSTDCAAASTGEPRAFEDAGLVINATPLGLHAHDPMPFDPSWLKKGAGVFDIIAARDTELMAACTARGVPVIGGKLMIEHQAAAQIAFWKEHHPGSHFNERVGGPTKGEQA